MSSLDQVDFCSGRDGHISGKSLSTESSTGGLTIENDLPWGVPPYVTVHDKTNHIVLGLNPRYEPNKSPVVIIIDFHFLAWIDRGIISLHKNLLRSF